MLPSPHWHHLQRGLSSYVCEESTFQQSSSAEPRVPLRSPNAAWTPLLWKLPPKWASALVIQTSPYSYFQAAFLFPDQAPSYSGLWTPPSGKQPLLEAQPKSWPQLLQKSGHVFSTICPLSVGSGVRPPPTHTMTLPELSLNSCLKRKNNKRFPRKDKPQIFLPSALTKLFVHLF